MTNLQQQISVYIVLFFLVVQLRLAAQNNYHLYIHAADRDSDFVANTLAVQNNFSSREACIEYVNRLPLYLQAQGYVTASLDSIRFDSTFAKVVLFLGDAYQWSQLDISKVDAAILQATGWRQKAFNGKPVDFVQVKVWQESFLNYLENNGYPFAKIYMDSIHIDEDKVSAQLKIDKGPLYKIDSIRIYGAVKISNTFLQRYLDIPAGSYYNKEKMQGISKKIAELAYVEEERASNLSLLGTGSVLNLYLKPKRSSQVNVLVGFLPNNDQLSTKKLLVTGEANINLRNALGLGETIGLNWQQLQVKSPRLNILYRHPYLFNSPVGLDFAFDMFRKNSTFLNINFQLGAQYILSARQAGKLFIQRFQTIVNGVNTNYILQNRRLPDEVDLSSFNVGVDYENNNTNYRLNPTKGNEFRIITSAGTKKINRNNEILQLKDLGNPSFDFGKLYDTVKLKSYQFRVIASAAKYFPAGRQGTFKMAINGGFFQSENIFRNELFQIGGYKLLRGFDEESQYLSQYAIGTAEYRYLIGINSYFFAFADGGWGRNSSQNTRVSYTYLGTGLGLALETRVGIFNLALAAGKRNDTEFNLRQSKIHFGFVNYF